MADLNTANREPIELKIGQVWYCHGGEFTIVALGPDYVGLTRPGSLPTCLPRATFESGRVRLVPAKHVLWVNVWRGGNLDTFLRPHIGKAFADAAARIRINQAGTVKDKRIACLKVEFSEGEGL